MDSLVKCPFSFWNKLLTTMFNERFICHQRQDISGNVYTDSKSSSLAIIFVQQFLNFIYDYFTPNIYFIINNNYLSKCELRFSPVFGKQTRKNLLFHESGKPLCWSSVILIRLNVKLLGLLSYENNDGHFLF